MLQQIEDELRRISASDIRVELDRDFAPDAGELVKVERADAYWHVLPQQLLDLLKDLPDDAGGEAVQMAIEKDATFVWHGPAPKGSRDP